jgi:hypothetical protein
MWIGTLMRVTVKPMQVIAIVITPRLTVSQQLVLAIYEDVREFHGSFLEADENWRGGKTHYRHMPINPTIGGDFVLTAGSPGQYLDWNLGQWLDYL